MNVQGEMRKLFVEGDAVFSFAWDAWSCEGDLQRQYLACHGLALTEDFRMLRGCMFIKRITGTRTFEIV